MIAARSPLVISTSATRAACCSCRLMQHWCRLAQFQHVAQDRDPAAGGQGGECVEGGIQASVARHCRCHRAGSCHARPAAVEAVRPGVRHAPDGRPQPETKVRRPAQRRLQPERYTRCGVQAAAESSVQSRPASARMQRVPSRPVSTSQAVSTSPSRSFVGSVLNQRIGAPERCCHLAHTWVIRVQDRPAMRWQRGDQLRFLGCDMVPRRADIADGSARRWSPPRPAAETAWPGVASRQSDLRPFQARRSDAVAQRTERQRQPEQRVKGAARAKDRP